MGDVYRARDTVLDRDVAIKILSPTLAADAEAVARLGREARLLAALNHPHIATLYGLEESDGVRALVIELLDGETLAERISRGRLPPGEALRVAAQIADALAAAHDKAIVHRDVKPENVQITAAGSVKVLDFGIAKAVNVAALETTIPTREGRVIGTPAYMSPEQARGEAVDRQTDVWSFGCVLFEMLSGRRAFDGATTSDAIAAVLEHEPAWSALPTTLPAGVLSLLRHCLEKDKARRLRDLRDVRVMLEIAGDPRASEPPRGTATPIRIRERIAWALALLLAIVALGLFSRRGAPSDRQVTQFDIAAPAGQSIANALAIAPDGTQLVFVGADSNRVSRLWLRRLDDDVPVAMKGTEGAAFPFWSPDGNTVAFFAGGKLKRVDLSGGQPVEIADAPAGRGGVWDRDLGIVFTPATGIGLARIPKPGGSAVPFTTLRPGETSHRMPFLLPDGYLGYYAMANDPSESGIWIAPVGTPASAARILRTSDGAQYSGGHLFFIRDHTLLAQHLDPERHQLVGDPIAVLDNVASSGTGFTALPAIAVSVDGSVVARRSRPAIVELTWLSRDGRQVEPLGVPPGPITHLELSPDGSRLAYQAGGRYAGELWTFDLGRHTAARASIQGAGVLAPLWFPNSDRLVVSSIRGVSGNSNLYEMAPEGGPLTPLVEAPAGMTALGWTADRRLCFAQAVAPPPVVIQVLGPDRHPAPYFDPHSNIATARVSPDGQAIAYTSNQSGRPEVYVIGYPSPGPVKPVSTRGGSQPRWRRDSRELFYLAPDGKLMALSIEHKGAAWNLGVPIPLVTVRTASAEMAQYQYDVARDGRFVVAVERQPSSDTLTVVRNWTSRHPQ